MLMPFLVYRKYFPNLNSETSLTIDEIMIWQYFTFPSSSKAFSPKPKAPLFILTHLSETFFSNLLQRLGSALLQGLLFFHTLKFPEVRVMIWNYRQQRLVFCRRKPTVPPNSVMPLVIFQPI